MQTQVQYPRDHVAMFAILFSRPAKGECPWQLQMVSDLRLLGAAEGWADSLVCEATTNPKTSPVDAKTAWLLFLLFPRLVLHYAPKAMLEPTPYDAPSSLAALLHQRLHEFRQGCWSNFIDPACSIEPPSLPTPDIAGEADSDSGWKRACRLTALRELSRAM